jgi:hypothetical protein
MFADFSNTTNSMRIQLQLVQYIFLHLLNYMSKLGTDILYRNREH